MARIIAASIDLSKIDKSKIVEGKNGAKYYNFDITVNDEPNQYGQDVALSDKQTKEERQAKAKKTFIGNGKTVWKNDNTGRVVDYTNPANPTDGPKDDLPF